MINISINNNEFTVNEGKTILEVARSNNIFIPTLCFLKNVNNNSSCRMCLVKNLQDNKLYTACSLKVYDGLNVNTNEIDVEEARLKMLNLIVSNHHFDCLNCSRKGKCELKKLMKKYNVESSIYKGEKHTYQIDDKSPSIVRDSNKCILCKRCVSVCDKIQNIGAINTMNRGFDSIVSTACNASLNDVNCTYCGQCIIACPTGALSEKENISKVKKALKDENKYVVVQTAPSIRVALGEEFGYEIGENVTGKMVSALNEMGFKKVFDTNTGADFTIMEEAVELVKRIQNNEILPMITSCSPAWVRFIEMNYPNYINHLSTCKSPHQMLGAVIKSYYAKRNKLKPENIFVVSVMPCTSKKYEITKKGSEVNGLKDVDAVITTRELAKLINDYSIDFKNLPEKEFDNPLGYATGAAAIFGTSGGVMEAAVRTAKDLLGDRSEKIVFEEIRKDKAIKKAAVTINNKEYKLVVVSGLKNADIILKELESGKEKYDFIEIMACPGGCIMGGGQPIVHSNILDKTDVRSLRASALYSVDEKSKIRKSHENPEMQKIYLEYIGKPGKEKAHELFHTVYEKTTKYNLKKEIPQ